MNALASSDGIIELKGVSVFLYLPRIDGDRVCLMGDRIDVRPAPLPTPTSSRALILNTTTSAGAVEIVLSAGEAAMLMFEIGHALEQANRLAESGNRPVRTADHARVLPSGDLP